MNSSLLIATVVGARPQFIKLAPVSSAIDIANGIQEVVIHTGQHYDDNMSKVFFDQLGIFPPALNLGVGSGEHGKQTGEMLIRLEKAFNQFEPDGVLVYGDTNSTLAGVLAAAKMNIPVAHIEAGLRSNNRRMPEEINRILTDHASDMLFAPTSIAYASLVSEGFSDQKTHLVGDVMLDAALYFGKHAENTSRIHSSLNLTAYQYSLVTIHRAENTSNPTRLQTILEGLNLISQSLPVVMPLHPRTRHALEVNDLSTVIDYPKIQFVEPVGYLDMLRLEMDARVVITDSGGVQKEAYFYEVPCVTLREETEWVELVEMGWNKLVPPFDLDGVVKGIQSMIDFERPAEHPDIFGDGKAATRIVELLPQLKS